MSGTSSKKLGFPEEMEDELVKIFEGEYIR